MLILSNGRPPRGRGRLDEPGPDTVLHRTTPARAGTTRARGPQPRPTPDDPRAGGDDDTVAWASLQSAGRPPRGRGRPDRRRRCGATGGTTPARAGTTFSSRAGSVKNPDDPRAGGDDRWPSAIHTSGSGRPPRGRGRRQEPYVVLLQKGTTPARAGTTTCIGRSARRGQDDPRAGGDDGLQPSGNTSPSGRPPRGRGRRTELPALRQNGRTTPARAGTTVRPCLTAGQ